MRYLYCYILRIMEMSLLMLKCFTFNKVSGDIRERLALVKVVRYWRGSREWCCNIFLHSNNETVSTLANDFWIPI